MPVSDNLVLLDPHDERWSAFINLHPCANIFHHPAWTSLLSECYGYRPFIAAVSDSLGMICAGLPLMEVNSPLTGRRWVSLPFTDYCNPLSCDTDSLEHLASGLIRFVQEGRIPRIEVRWELPTRATIATSSSYVLHKLQLDPDPGVVNARLHRNHRQNIKTAEKRGVRIEVGTQPDHVRLFYQLQLATRQRHGVPIQPWRYFRTLSTSLIHKGMAFVLLAYKDDQCLSGAVFLHWNGTLIAKYAASRADTLNLRPNDLLFWNAISWACENGCTVFDMGRTECSDSGLREFKRRWGAEETPITYSILSSKPVQSKNAINGKLEKTMDFVIRRSPTWVCRAAGELLYGHFG